MNNDFLTQHGLTTFSRLHNLGLAVRGRHLNPERHPVVSPGGIPMTGATTVTVTDHGVTAWSASWRMCRSVGTPPPSVGGAPLPVHGLLPCVESTSVERGTAAFVLIQGSVAVDGESAGDQPPAQDTDRDRPGRGLRHSQRRSPDRRQTVADRRAGASRQSHNDRCRRASVATHPPRGRSTSPWS